MTAATEHPLSGLWQPTQIQRLYYGPSSVQKHLLSCLPKDSSKAFIITGSSLANKTQLIKQVEQLLGSKHHAGTFSDIKQHAPVAQLNLATEAVHKDSNIDTLISIGGGSPIDSAKAISFRTHEKTDGFLYHIAIPTTLSAAECSYMAGYSKEDGTKTSVKDPALAPHVVIYDAKFALETPQRLWLSTGLRSVDHAMELLYNPYSVEAPTKQLCLTTLSTLFTYLPKCKENPQNEDYITRVQLAAFSSLYPYGTNVKGGIGLSHSLGYALAPYDIPHGINSCLTLGKVIRLKAEKPEDAAQIARVLPFIGQTRSGDDRKDAIKVGDAIEKLVTDLELESKLGDYQIGEDQCPTITKAATGKESGELYDKVSVLVKSML